MKNARHLQASEHRELLDALQAAQEAIQSLPTHGARTGAEQESVLRGAYEQARYAAHRIGSLWVAARFDAGEFQPDSQPVPVHALVETALQQLSSKAGEHGVKLQSKFEPTPPILGDRELLQSLLTNLLASVIDICQRDTRVLISAFEHDERVLIKLEDAGASRQLFPDLMEGSDKEGGSSQGESGPLDVGILTARSIVEAHEGEMWAEPQGGAGGALLLAFPPAAEVPAEHWASEKMVLIVDDDPDGAFMIEQVLAKGGFRTEIAPDGLSGLARAKAEDVGLVLLDVMLPGMDGFEVCHRLRSDPATADLPIVMISAKSRPDDIDTGLRMGANAYLTKPLRLAEVVEQVKELMVNAS